MSRHGKSKGKSRIDKPGKVREPKPRKSAVAAEATGTQPREDVVRQEPPPASAIAKREAAVRKPPARAAAPVVAKREAAVRKPPAPAAASAVAKREAAVGKPPAPAPTALKREVVVAESSAPSPEVESAVETLQRSLQAARHGTVEVNRLLLDIGRQNVASGFDLARSLAAARTPIEAARLQLAFFDERMKALLHQAEALRALSADLVSRANEPIREHMRFKGLTAWWR